MSANVLETAAAGLPFDAAGRYHVREVLGSGAFGIVYRVLDQRWGQEVALKTIQDTTPEGRQWLKAEYRTLRDILHPNLVRLHDLHVEEKHCFFTMEIVPGGRVFTEHLDFDRSAPRGEQEGAIRRICRAGLQLAEALRTVHAFGKTHRDVKPTNVLVTTDGHLVLLDFGMAGPMTRQKLLDTARGAVVGTLPYLAPEQYWEPRPLPASDWYSAGLVLYETLVGRLPFGDNPVEEAQAKQRLPVPPSTFVPAVPPAVDRLVLGLLEPNPERRLPVDELLTLLREQGEEVGATALLWSPRAEAERDFVGRQEELLALHEAYATAQEGRFVTVDVVGPSGMGKTALIREFLRSVSEGVATPALVLEARCHPHESIPYKAFDAAVDDLTRYWLGLDESAAAAICPEEGIEALALLFPELRRVPVVDSRAKEMTVRGDPRALRQVGFLALRNLLARVATRQPTVLWLDDVQWADADSAALVEGVFGASEPPPIELVLSRRLEDEALQPALPAALSLAKTRGRSFEINLAPLPEDSAVSLARRITSREGGAGADALGAILEEAAGVPYLVAELAHFAARRGDRRAEGSLQATAGSLLRERLQALSSQDRTLVEIAALSGAAQRAVVLLDAAGSRDPQRLRDLCVRRLLRWTGTGEIETLQIYHDRLREFVVGALPADVSVRHHLSLVIAMEATGSGDAEQLMAHSLAAGDRPRTSRHAMTAARRAETALAFEQAARLYEIALKNGEEGAPRAELHGLLAEAMANAGHSTRAAPEFERASAAIASESPGQIERRGFFRRRAGEQYLKAGHFDDGLRLMEAFLREADVRLPRTGNGALAISAARRLQLYVRGFQFQGTSEAAIPPRVRSRLDDLWAATTALSMMDPVRADGVGLLHFIEALRAGSVAHVARSLGYEAAFAALIGGGFLRRKSRDLLRRNQVALDSYGGPYERAFYKLGAGSSDFFHSEWTEATRHCDAAAVQFRAECRGAEYEAAVAVVFSLQALGQAGHVAQLVARIPAAIREAEARGDLFAANNYRGGFHGVGRIAAGRVDEVASDLQRVVETWKPGFYQMHAYHRVFAGVALDLYTGNPRSAVARIEGDWPELQDGLFLRMELPAMELRWARARAALALAGQAARDERKKLLAQVGALRRSISRSTTAAARPHASLLAAGMAAMEGRRETATTELRSALAGYTAARMAMHREVARWALARIVGSREGHSLMADVDVWAAAEGVPDMEPLARALAPGVEKVFRAPGVA